ncbi:hypothetical protein RSAG8_12809, partial [Rhizoctonia solani AG-8 WAC10335]
MSVATRPPPFSPGGSGEAENWDDDFLFQAEDSPAKPPAKTRKEAGPSRPPDRRWSGQSQVETLAWDEELEREEAERQSSASSSLGQAAGGNVDLSRWAEGDDDDDAEFGLASRRVSDAFVPEDTVSPLPVFPHNPVASNSLPSPKRARTNTSPSRSSESTSRSASAQSSPLLPTRQIPSSPALSLFSMSTSTAQPYTPSLAGSTAHLRHTRSRDASSPDDDFLFQAEDSPAKPPAKARKEAGPSRPPDRRWSGQSQVETLAWDEELEREEAERQSSASSSLGQAAGGNVDLSRWAEGDDDDDAEFGLASRRVSDVFVPEDTVSPLPVFPHNPVASNSLPSPKRARTNTSPSRSSESNSQSASAQSSPLLPTRQIPSSPALSLFSMSTSTAQPPSLAGSTAHLRHTRSRDASSPVGSFVPAQPRVTRRRLRKKSRPARPGDIAEDESPYVMRSPSPQGLGLAEEEASWSESSNPPERTPSPVQSPIAGPSSPPSRTPLLSRIGSLKNKLGRHKGSSTSPPSSSTGPPTTPGRPSRTSTTPQTPRPRAPSWFRPSQGSSPEDQAPGLTHRRSKEPFWKNVGSFSSGRSPVEPSESDHESTVKKPPRKSVNGRPPLDVFPTTEEAPALPRGPGSPTPPSAKLTKPRRPISMGGPNRPSGPPANRTAASLGRGTGLGWITALDDAEESSILRSLRKFSGQHGRKRSGDGIPRIPSSSAGTSSSRVPSSSNMSSRRPSLSLSAAVGVVRTASMSSPTSGPRSETEFEFERCGGCSQDGEHVESDEWPKGSADAQERERHCIIQRISPAQRIPSRRERIYPPLGHGRARARRRHRTGPSDNPTQFNARPTQSDH